MTTLILSDIHANYPAFRAVLEKAPHWDDVLFLGDIANFGPYPSECVNLLRELNAINIMGNHDLFIADSSQKRNDWEEWARQRLSREQLDFILSFKDFDVSDNILSVHGIYSVDYDILPNTPDEDIVKAFSTFSEKADTILFGHYHYQIDRKIAETEYHCIRAVGHHRDKDVRAGFSVLKDGKLTHYRTEYDIERLLFETERKVDCYNESFMKKWLELTKNAYSEEFLAKDIKLFRQNEARNGSRLLPDDEFIVV